MGYAHEMTDEQHRKSVEVLLNYAGMVVLPHALYDGLLRGWPTRTTRSRVNHAHSTRVEQLWINQVANELLYPLFAGL